MITKVHLENWRAYKSFTIDLGPGTTFLVAPNGVGKTSFIEAVQWALDRDAMPTSKVMRRRARSTTVDVTLLAGQTPVRIKRTLTLGRGKTPADNTEVWIDSNPAETADALALLAEAWDADNRFVSRAAFLTDRFVDKDPDPDLRTHLTRLHALDHVQSAIVSVSSALKTATDEADSARKAAAASDAELGLSTAAAKAASEQHEASITASQELRTASADADQTLAAARRTRDAHDAYNQWMNAHAQLASEVSTLLGTASDELDLRPTLRAAEAAARRQLVENAEQRARLEERLAAVEEALERLHQAGAECPVCRRALDDASRHHAEQEHERDRAAAAQQINSLDADAPTTAAAAFRGLLDRAEALGDPPAPPTDEQTDLELLQLRAVQAKAAFEKSLEDLGRAERVLAEANERLAAIEADRAASSRTLLYTRVAALEAAKAALESTITGVLDTQLGPVRDEVNRRWEAIFPDRPGLRIDPDGGIARAFDDEESADLDFDSFSSGEQVVAKLLLRLATLTSTTRVPFWMIDEPLEHLDPDARSYVARTLAYLGSGGALSQIFVTTYEQDLAMQLVGIAREQVHLEFLRTAHVLP
jgi:DNA repair exonuclease SbcCD ATPase subunit